MTTTHTPTPWTIEPCNASYSRRIVAPNGDTIAVLAGQNGRDAERDANGAAILRAVNAHEALRAFAQKVADTNTLFAGEASMLKAWYDMRGEARAALALAEKE